MRRQPDGTAAGGPGIRWDWKSALRGWQRLLVPLGILLVVSIVAVGVFGHGNWRGAQDLLVFYAASVLVVPVHELGHAAFGHLVGLKIARVVVGQGKPLLQKRIGGVTWQWNMLPFGGLTMAAPFDGTRFVRLRYWFFALGGPVAHGAVAALAWWLFARLRGSAGPVWMLDTAGNAAAIGLLLNLLPLRLNVEGTLLPSDGRQLLTTPFLKGPEIQNLFVAYYVVSGNEEGLAGNHAAALGWFDKGLARYPQGATTLRCMRAHALHRLGRLKEAKAEIAAVLDGTPDPALRALALNDWSWYAFLDRDDADLHLADQRSAEALALKPNLAAVAGTRGAVLLWRGYIDQALPLLQHNFNESSSSAFSRSSNGSLLAVAHAANGDADRAQAALDGARVLDATNVLVGEAAALLAALAATPRLIRAARGGRMVGVHDDAVEFFDRADRAGRRVPFDEISTLHIGLTARGKARLSIGSARTRWHMPLDPAALWSARLAFRGFFALRPLSLPIAVAQAPAGRAAHLLGQIAAFAALMAMSFGKGGLDGFGLASALFGILSVTTFVASGPAPLLALGASTLLGIWMSLFGQRESILAPGSAEGFWMVVQGAVGGLALVAGWMVLRLQPDRRKHGLRMTVGALLFMMCSLTAILGAVQDPSAGGLAATVARHAVVGISAASLAIVLTFVAPRWRIAAFVLGTLGAGWLLVATTAFQDRYVLAHLGPQAATLEWTVQNAIVLREEKLPAGVTNVMVSPAGRAYAARFLATDSDASEDDGSDDESATDLGSPSRAKLFWVVGDFGGHRSTVAARQARFIDDQRILLVTGANGTVELREISVADTGATRIRIPLPNRRSPELFAGMSRGTVHLVTPDSAEAFEDRVWSLAAGLDVRGRFPALAPRETLIGVVDTVRGATRSVIGRWPPREVSEGRSRRRWSAIRPDLIVRGPAGDRVILAKTFVECAGPWRPGELLCVVQATSAAVLVAIDVLAGTIRRVASVPGGYGPATILDNGRIAIGVRGDLAVLDVDAHRAWLLVMPEHDPGAFSTELTSAGLAMVRAKREGGKRGPATLMVLAPPQ